MTRCIENEVCIDHCVSIRVLGSRIGTSAIDYHEDSWDSSSTRLRTNEDLQFRALLAFQARLWVYCLCFVGRHLHLDRDPLQTSHFAATKGLMAQTLAPDDAQGRSRSGQVKSSRVKSSQVKAGQSRSRQVKAGQGRSGQVRTSIVVSTTTTTTTTTATTKYYYYY